MAKEILKKWHLFSVLLLLGVVIMAGCGAGEPSPQHDVSVPDEMEESGQQFPVTITDGADQEVTIDAEPETIVSIQASHTEIAFALGLGDKLVGVSDFCNYPVETQNIQKVGGQDFNVELVLALLPDIALVTPHHYDTHPEMLRQLEEAGIDVIVVGSAASFEEVYDNIEMIGRVTGKHTEAKELISDMEQRLEVIENKATEEVTDKKRVWVEVSPSPSIVTTGKNTFMHEMLESIQAINVAEDHEGWPKLTEEEIVQLNPEVIITTYGFRVEGPKDLVLAREGWAEVPAVKNKQVFDVHNDTVTRPGPRLIEGVETLAKFIYPEVFKQ